MRIMAIADEESAYLWDHFEKSKLEGIDLIISCGDLHPHYLSFLATFTSAPVLYVHGNHDEKYEQVPPDGCTCIDDDIFVYEGIRILGLGGSMRYRPGRYQYTEQEMRRRVRRLRWKLFRHHGFDILVTHAPAYQLNDGRDLPHQGFKSFITLMDKYHPRFFLHGHVHMSYGRQHKRYDKYQDTHVINAYERYVFDYETGVDPELATSWFGIQ
ncbi:MAG: metallophosphoesterase [Lachnospiraceae bacterium]|nr:metallophosphoesterase [Lachnospiraceae bacterium]